MQFGTVVHKDRARTVHLKYERELCLCKVGNELIRFATVLIILFFFESKVMSGWS